MWQCLWKTASKSQRITRWIKQIEGRERFEKSTLISEQWSRRQDESRVAKHDWVNKELPGTQLLLRNAKHKKDFASPTSILIDDRIDNVEGWIGAGGIGILHKNTKDTIKQLKRLKL